MSSILKIISFIVPIIIVVACGTLVVWSRQPEQFPIRAIEIRSSLKEVTEEEIQKRIAPFIQEGFFWLNVQAVQDSLKTLPWVQEVDLRRQWPDKLVVKIQEKTAQARWGEQGLLSTEGIIFYPVGALSETLPQFYGVESRAKEMLQHYFMLLEMLGPMGLRIKRLDLSEDGCWRMKLDSDLSIILGKSSLNERLTRFMLTYKDSLITNKEKIDYIDVRYTNGFAIGWK